MLAVRWILRLSAWCSPPFRDDYTTAGRNACTARVGVLDEEGHMEDIVWVGRLLDAVVDIMLVIASVILAFHFWNEWRRG